MPDKDAVIRMIGTPDDALLAQTVTISTGRNRQDKQFKAITGTVSHLIDMLGYFEVGPKDGRCIVSGEVIGGARIANNMRANSILMLDIDNGMSIEEMVDKIRDVGLFAMVWTTHSHMKDTSAVKEQVLQQ